MTQDAIGNARTDRTQDGQPAAERPPGGPAVTGPSFTALTAAAARAAHLVVDSEPLIFTDQFASVLLGDQAGQLIGFHRAKGEHPVLAGARGQVVVRSRYAEDRLAHCAASGISQYVILGAGLDSFGCRPGLAGQVRVFEVDHPASQAWKRAALARAGIGVPATVTYVAADLAAGSFTDALAAHGFELSQPAVVSWLGVTMYLTRPAIERTLAAAARLAPGTELITDYMLPAGQRDEEGDSYAALVAPAAAEHGEPWRTLLGLDDMAGLLARHGFAVAEQVGQREAIAPALWQRRDALRPVRLSMLARAVVTGRTRAGTPR